MTDTVKVVKNVDISSAGVITFFYEDGTKSKDLVPKESLNFDKGRAEPHIQMACLNMVHTLYQEVEDLKKRVNALTKATNGLMRF